MSIVLVDDNEIDIFINLKLIEKQNLGIELFAFTDTTEAFDYITAHSEVTIVILDNQMPKLNGYELAKKLRNECQFEFQIVILSATIGPMDQMASNDLDPTIILWEKPLEPSLLVNLLSSRA